jgi:hypothetical protein
VIQRDRIQIPVGQRFGRDFSDNAGFHPVTECRNQIFFTDSGGFSDLGRGDNSFRAVVMKAETGKEGMKIWGFPGVGKPFSEKAEHTFREEEVVDGVKFNSEQDIRLPSLSFLLIPL